LSESPSHAVAYYRLEAAWTVANRLKTLDAGTARADSTGLSVRRYWAAAAASVLLTAGFFAFLASALRGYQYSTPVGGIATVPMADGSKVTLNTDSSIRISLSTKERHVDLEQGEAFFDVAKDATRPFIVSAGEKRITATGTQFSVRRDGDIARVFVSEGRVRVDTASGGASSQIAAGQEAEARAGKVTIEDKPAIRVEDALRWRSGFLVFHEEPFADAVKELNRYNERKIHIPDLSSLPTHLCGTIRTDNPDGFVRLMQEGSQLEITTEALPHDDFPKSIFLPPGDLSSALDAAIQQSSVQILYECDVLRGLKNSGASGRLTGQQAITKIIQGTPLTLRTDVSGVMLIVTPKHFSIPKRNAVGG
jgi:transmembrane sensor